MEVWQGIGTVGVGVAAGVLSGMFGVGGAVLSTPGIRLLGASPILAVGSTVPAILPGALTGAARYAKQGLVDWRIGLVCGGTGAALAVGGAWVASNVNAGWLMVLTAVLLLWSGISVARSGRRQPGRPAERPGAEEAGIELEQPDDSFPRAALPVLVAVGAGSGFLAGLLGVGGGVVMMPAFTVLLRMPVKRAVASSLVAVAIFSVPALITHAALGNIDWAYALLLVVGTVPGARIGAKVALAASDTTVRRLFGLFLVVLAVIYGGAELVNVLSA